MNTRGAVQYGTVLVSSTETWTYAVDLVFQVRTACKAQKCHILLSLRAFVRMETHRLLTGISGYAAKIDLIREVIRLYLKQRTITLKATA